MSRRTEGLAPMDTATHLSRAARFAFAALAAASLAGCLGGGGGSTSGALDLPPAAVQTAQPVASAGPTIGTGSVKVALILPLSGPGQAQVAAASLRNAAELAIAEFQGPDLTILVKDDAGTSDGARDATQQAVAEGAELIIGPLFAGSVRAAAQVARQANRPVLAFSTDASVASRGVYLLSFLPQSEVGRLIDYASAQGRRSFAALIPDTPYGGVVEAEFREATARRGARVVAIERYGAGQAQAAVARLAPAIAGAAPQADALFLPENAEGLPGVAEALRGAGFNPQRVKPVGTGVWDDPRVLQLAALQGGWYAAPDATGFETFAGRYRARFGSDPTRLATLSYDAVSLAAALVRTQGTQRFSESALTNPAGFAGADGVFRFRSDGTNDRALTVYEIRNGAAAPISPAPRNLSGAPT
jgi:ABC-type branched-subunit amino acid transport system substrate-binding protein